MARRSFLGTAGTVVASLVLVGLLITAHSYFITPEQETAPISHAGTRGEAVDTRRYTIEVDKVRLAESVVESGGFSASGAQKAKGVWVVVRATVEATKDPMRPGAATLTNGDDFEFAASTQVSTTVDQTTTPYEPGIPRRGLFAFELPEKRLEPPLTLRMNMTEGGLDDRLSAEAEIDLALDEADIDALRSKVAKKVSIPEPGHP